MKSNFCNNVNKWLEAAIKQEKTNIDASKKFNNNPYSNFIRFLTTDDQKKCSIVLEYAPKEAFLSYSCCSGNDIKVINNSEDCYYGLHPSISDNSIINAILEGDLFTECKFEELLKSWESKFTLHSGQKEYIKALFAMTVLRMASRFGTTFYVAKDISKEFLETVRKGSPFLKGINYKVVQNSDPVKFIILGGLTKEMIEFLDLGSPENTGVNACRFCWIRDNRTFKIIKKNDEDKRCQLFSEIPQLFKKKRKEIMDNPRSKTNLVTLQHGSVYYSGVLPRLLDIQILDTFSNQNVQTIKLIVERTTFATVDAMDNVDIISHPFLAKYGTILHKFINKENQVHKHLINSTFSDQKNVRDILQKYLTDSSNTNIIAVSGNILTGDGWLIAGKRSSQVIDQGTFYCSVNGQSEFVDSNVDFYKDSIYEDCPTLSADSKMRLDFEKELARETFAELNLSQLNGTWNYFGLSILGIINNEKNITERRRMHFNILASNSTNLNFLDIYLGQKKALECFENEAIYGINILIHKTSTEKVMNNIIGFLKFIRKNDSIIAYFLGFVLILLNFIFNKNNQSDIIDYLNTISSTALALFVITDVFIQLKHKIKDFIIIHPYLRKISFIKEKEEGKTIEKAIRILKKDLTCHPIFTLLVMLHIHSLLSDKIGKPTKDC